MEAICYEHIKDDFYFGLYGGEFKVVIMKRNGYINATKLCKDGGKLFKNWMRNDDSKNLIEQFEKILFSLDGGNGSNTIWPQVVIKINEQLNILKGTYVHFHLIPHIASWVSPMFAFKVSSIVTDYIINEFNNESKDKINERESEIMELNQKLRDSNLKYNKVEEDISPKTTDGSKLQAFAIFELNDPEETYNFYALRVQKRSFNSRFNNVKERHPQAKLIVSVDYTPNSVTLFNRFREQMCNDADFHRNYFNITPTLCESNLKELITRMQNRMV